MLTVGGGLSIVLGLFLVIALATAAAPLRGSMGPHPEEVFDNLVLAAAGSHGSRCNSCAAATSCCWSLSPPYGTETLTEVTDPLEVDRIAGICQRGNPKSSTAAFRQVFQQLVSKECETGQSPFVRS